MTNQKAKDKTQQYLTEIKSKFKTGQARELAYRSALEKYFENITKLRVVNEPKRSQYGSPDFVFLKGKSTIAYAETKDIGVLLDKIEKTEQLERYYGYSNLILTDYLEFRFFRNGEKYGDPIKIAELKDGKIEALQENFKLLEDTVKDFIKESREPIKSGLILAKIMAAKARRIRDSISHYLTEEVDDGKNENLLAIYKVIKELLLSDLDYKKFADMYAQTVVYGLFAARYYDKTPNDFSRQEARDLVPASNPFLRHFFDHITGPSFDKRIEIIVNELCEEFTNTDVHAIINDYYKIDKDDSRDPIIHFYEDFLQEYDPQERIDMGVFFTPLPVVRFIVRSIDEILRTEFNLKGLSDSSLTQIKKEIQGKKGKWNIHKVQILDPASGTGTFLNEAILKIKESFKGQEGRWSKYMQEDLLPRLNGFELMMAPYTISHLKLSTTIKETGAEVKDRIRLYLTNSLEMEDDEPQTLFDSLGLTKAITKESLEADKIKKELPIMVVVGNPPYNVSSQNKGKWIMDLLKDYKKDLKERKINIDDDYIKFIRLAEYLIDKNGEGVVGMITNNSFIDGITYRQMRKHLLETFDKIYILNLHGDVKKKEKAPDGGKDENVFDIQQGVGIWLFIKKEKSKNLAKVYYKDIYGTRKYKFETLNNCHNLNIKWSGIDYKTPYYFFTPKDFQLEEEYNNGFSLDSLFLKGSTGIETKVDSFAVDFEREPLLRRVEYFLKEKPGRKQAINEYGLSPKTTWEIDKAKNAFFSPDKVTVLNYRIFDTRYTFYDNNFLARSRSEVMDNIFERDNLVLVTARQTKNNSPVFVSKIIGCRDFFTNHSHFYPLYTYNDHDIKQINFDDDLFKAIAAHIKETVTPENLFDYIYAILYSPAYREKYKEFLKIDFPRVPYPKSEKQFFELAKLGEELRRLHLFEHPKLNNYITTYPVIGDNVVGRVNYKGGRVYINKVQYFGGVPTEVWEFYIGAYQPSQKWLKDRKGRELSSADIEHYQKMIVAMAETIKTMREIDKIVKL